MNEWTDKSSFETKKLSIFRVCIAIIIKLLRSDYVNKTD